MHQSNIKQPISEILNYKGHKFEIITKRDQLINLHSVTEIKVDGITIITLTDVYADFDIKGDPKIDLIHYHNHLSAGWIDLKTLIQWKEK